MENSLAPDCGDTNCSRFNPERPHHPLGLYASLEDMGPWEPLALVQNPELPFSDETPGSPTILAHP